MNNNTDSWKVWTDIDHYNEYLKTKKFDNPMLHTYDHRQFDSINRLLNDYKRRYDYILKELSNKDKRRLKNGWCDHLEKLKNIQTDSEYKEIISDLIELVNKDYLLSEPMSSLPQVVKVDKADSIVNLHADIFKGNAFEMWLSMFDSFKINETSRTDVKFIFEEMKTDGLINETVSQKSFLDWITKNNNGLIVEKTSNHNRTTQRISIYNTAKTIYIK